LCLALCLLSGCTDPLPVTAFATTMPALDPVRFFTGAVRSWGVLEDRGGQPTQIVTTECGGEAEGRDGLHMVQRLHVGTDPVMTRDWHMRRTGPGRYQATANDMVGTATGEASGRAFHWHWVLAIEPGDPVKHVTMDQWWYLLDDGSMLNRTTISKLGVILAEVTEHFARGG
jgi:hypothetical protein